MAAAALNASAVPGPAAGELVFCGNDLVLGDCDGTLGAALPESTLPAVTNWQYA
jgi:hypothetical protein